MKQSELDYQKAELDAAMEGLQASRLREEDSPHALDRVRDMPRAPHRGDGPCVTHKLATVFLF